MTTTQTIAGATHPLHTHQVCFSFAAYSKSIINHLRSCGIPIADGLSEIEFAAIESTHHFQFPPDLRSILREGLPVGTGFPNWRSASPNHLQFLLSLPISALIHQIEFAADFWPPAWGPRPQSLSQSIAMARLILSGAAQLVPVYRQFYIAANPNLAGNPLFYIRGGDVRCCGFDLADFYRREEICLSPAAAPAWIAKEARRIDVWSDLAGGGGGGGGGGERGKEEFMKEMGRRLVAGGWGEEEVREMLMAGESDRIDDRDGDRTVVMDRESVLLHVRGLALVMLRAGWSKEDVVYALGGSSTQPRHLDPHSTSN